MFESLDNSRAIWLLLQRSKKVVVSLRARPGQGNRENEGEKARLGLTQVF